MSSIFLFRQPFRTPAAATVALATLGCALPGAGPSTMPAPEPGHPIYETHVRIDPDAAALEATTRFSFVANGPAPGSVAFLLNRGLRLHDVRGAAVRSFATDPFDAVPAWNVVRVELDPTIGPGREVTLELRYSGTLELPENDVNEISTERVELSLDSQWHPIFASFDQQMRGVLRIEGLAGWQVVASGSTSIEGEAHLIHGDVRQPDVAFIAKPSFERVNSANFTVYHREAGTRAAAAVRDAGESCARYLNDRYGGGTPLPSARVVLVDRGGPGYARKNYIVLSEVDPDDAVDLHYFLCHELAHFWTPSPGPFSPDHWMSEAFAEYVAVRYLRVAFGEEAFEVRRQRWEEMGRGHGPVWTAELERRPDFFVMYRRAPQLLHLLEQRIGSDRFDRFVQLYMMEDVRTTSALLDRLAIAAGPAEAEWFREQLARGPEGGW